MSSKSGTLELYAPNIEQAILSSVMFDEESKFKIFNSLSVEDFFIPAHKQVFEIMLQLESEDMPVDEAFIMPELQKKNKDSEMVIVNIMSANPISSIEPYVDMLKEFTQKRKLYDLSISIRKQLSEDVKPMDMLQNAEAILDNVSVSMDTKTSSRSMEEIVTEIEDDMEKARSGEKVPYFKTGYNNFDSYAGGFVENGLTVIAARPSMGKSSFTSGPIVSAIERNEAGILYSMEVIDKNALLRLISFRSQEPLSGLKMGSLKNYTEYKKAKSFFIENNDMFAIVDRSGMSKKDLEIDIIKRIRDNPNIKVILIDHLLQMQIDSSKHAPTELGDITKMLKRIAQNYKVSVVLLSQLNRSVESRENKRPMMSDLQGSGSIEQDADMIIFLYRPEYYKEKEWDSEEKGEYVRPDIEHAEAIIGKNRDGPTGSVELGFRAKTASFLNDGSPIETIDYIDEDIDENGEYKAPTQGSCDIITYPDDNSSISMPPI